MTAQTEPSIAETVLASLTKLRDHIVELTKQRDAAIKYNEHLVKENIKLRDDLRQLRNIRATQDDVIEQLKTMSQRDQTIEPFTTGVAQWWVRHDLTKPVHPACVVELLDAVIGELGVDRRAYAVRINAKLDALRDPTPDYMGPEAPEHVRVLMARILGKAD
jgi:hypothetical protein